MPRAFSQVHPPREIGRIDACKRHGKHREDAMIIETFAARRVVRRPDYSTRGASRGDYRLGAAAASMERGR